MRQIAPILEPRVLLVKTTIRYSFTSRGLVLATNVWQRRNARGREIMARKCQIGSAGSDWEGGLPWMGPWGKAVGPVAI